MSATADSHIVAQPAESAEGAVILVAWALTLALIALWIGPMAAATIRDGLLFDNDDAMRLVQLRDWMGGASWYDVTQHRIDPPAGTLMHWSRLPEFPLAVLINLLAPLAGPELAERIVIALGPPLLLAGLILLILALANRLVSPAALFAAAIVIALNPLLLFQFAPGRIDHHGLQLVLTWLLAITTLVALVDLRPGAAVLAGSSAALMTGIGLETVPIIGAAAAVFGTAWVVRGQAVRVHVMLFGLALAAGTLLVFLYTVPASRWLLPEADALSLPWLWFAVAGGLTLASLAAMHMPEKTLHRALWGAAGGGVVLLVAVVFWPAVLAGPYAKVDPLVQDLWLTDVGETKTLLRMTAERPGDFLSFLVFLLGGWTGLAVMAWREGRDRPELLVLLAFATAAVVTAMATMRGAPFAALFTLFGWLALIDVAFAPLARPGRRRLHAAGAAVASLLVAMALPFGWSALGSQWENSSPQPVVSGTCSNRDDMAALAAEANGLVLAPIRLGPRILVATPHAVLAAPYHRNNAGNRLALEMLTSIPATAKRQMAARGVRYIAICLADTDLPRLTQAAPGSLIAQLAGGTQLPWLAPLPETGTIRAWSVVP